MKLGPVSRKALEFIRDNPNCQASDLAGHLWPDSNMHRRVSNQGHGACAGKAAWLQGGSLVGKLNSAGLVHREHRPPTVYRITQKGRDALK